MSHPFTQLSRQALFLVWGPPSHGPRSQVFARELGIDELHFVYSLTKRGGLTTPLRYAYQAVQTLRLLFRERPKVVFVQSPPSLAVWFVYLYGALTDNRYVVDAHSAALLSPYWTRPQWLYRFLARKAVATIVTNEHFERMIMDWGGKAFILRDIPTTFPQAGSYDLAENSFNVAVVNSFAPDEPLDEVLEAAAELTDIHFYVTGRKSRANPGIIADAPTNVYFTDFLPDESYYALLRGSDAVMCLTTRNYTMQRGACEALSLGKPIITSDWPLLRDYFNKGTVHVPNTSDGIRHGLMQMRAQRELYEAGIVQLQIDQRHEWESKIKSLANLIEQSFSGHEKVSGEEYDQESGAK
jgi:glycosyltransferase involved in cell wall biosynthesis